MDQVSVAKDQPALILAHGAYVSKGDADKTPKWRVLQNQSLVNAESVGDLPNESGDHALCTRIFVRELRGGISYNWTAQVLEAGDMTPKPYLDYRLLAVIPLSR
jgi:hypothetical protein